MPEIRLLCDKIEKSLNDLREKSGQKPWADFTRKSFIYNVTMVIPELEEIYTLFQSARIEIEKNSETSKPELGFHLKDLSTHITILKRNKELEEKRLEKTRARGIHDLADAVTVPELYADLEQKTLSLILKSTYLVERMRIFERKKEPIMNTKAAQRNVLDLLEKREDEIANLRKKYDETRKNYFLGLVEKESSIETEQELNEIARSLGSKTSLAKKEFETAKNSFEETQRHLNGLEERIMSIEELEAQMTGKTFELITLLKKERDYLKKVLIEIEQDTIQLRNTYSKELLGLQEEKLSLRNNLEERHEKQEALLRKEIVEKNDLLRHFRDNASENEKKISRLEEQNEKLQLLNMVLEKHSKARGKFAEKTVKAKKESKKKSGRKKSK